MELFLIGIDNGYEYGDYDEKHKLVVAENTIKAAEIAVVFMNENYSKSILGTPGFRVTQIKEVDGYEIIVKEEDLS